jgi:hypothetical protein
MSIDSIYKGGNIMYNYKFYVTNYEGRLLILFDNTTKGISGLFYRSSGSATPEIKKAGEVFPILGILGEGKLGSEMSKYYPDMNDGWIIKTVKDGGRNDIKSYIGSEDLRDVCIRLERLIAKVENTFGEYQVVKLNFNEWIDKVDEYHLDKNTKFLPSRLLNRVA